MSSKSLATMASLACVVVATTDRAAGQNTIDWVQFPNWIDGDLSGVGSSPQLTVAADFQVLSGSFESNTPQFTNLTRDITDPSWPFDNKVVRRLAADPNGDIEYIFTYSYQNAGGLPAGGTIAIIDLEAPSSTIEFRGFQGGQEVPVEWVVGFLELDGLNADFPTWDSSTNTLGGSTSVQASRTNLVFLTTDRPLDEVQMLHATTNNDSISFATAAQSVILDGCATSGNGNLLSNCSFEYALDNGGAALPGVVDPNTGLARDAFGPPIASGSFDDSIYVLNNGSTAVDGWLAVSATPGATTDWVHSQNYAASDGVRSMDLNGTPGPGGVAQFVEVTPGGRYLLEFDLAGNPRGLEDPDGEGSLVPPTSFDVTIEVDADGATREFSFTVAGQTPSDPGWERQSWELNTFDSELLLQLLSTTAPLYPGELIDFGPIVDNVSLVQVGVAGDYNADGVVDAADYTVWRDSLNDTGLTPFSGADGDGDGQVTSSDYDVWRDNYGALFGAAPEAVAEAVPEPASLALGVVLLTGVLHSRR